MMKEISHIRRRLWIGLMLVLGGMTPLTSFGLQFDVFIGYGNVVREVNWFPVTCEVMNDGPAFRGTIEISGAQVGTGQKRRLTLDLPTNTRKRVVIPVFNPGGGFASWDGRLYDESGELVAEQPGVRIKEVAWEGILMGSVSRNFAGAPKFPPFREATSNLQPAIGRIAVDQFPDSSIALEGLSSLYLNSEPALKLTATQVKALTEWVFGGGHLILSIEQPTDVTATDWLIPLTPFLPESVSQVEVGSTFYDWFVNVSEEVIPARAASQTGTERVFRSRGSRSRTGQFTYGRVNRDLALESESIPIVTGRLIEGAVLMEAEGKPLVVSGHRGRGTVTVLTFSPEREPFRSWQQSAWFWAKLNRVPYEWFEMPRFTLWGGSSVDGIFGSLIESRQVRKLPVRWLLLLLVVYLLVIGPFDHWFLKRINRQMLTWITFPAYVVFFSALIYLIGYKLRSGDLEWNELHIVDVTPTPSDALLRGRSFASVYSPSNQQYDVGCDEPGAVFRPEFLGPAAGGQDSSGVTIQQLDSGMAARVFVPVWLSRLFVADWTKRGASPISVVAEEDGPGYRVTISNLSGRPIGQLAVVVDGRYYSLNGMAAGESRVESIDASDGNKLSEFIGNNTSNYHRALGSRRQALGDTYRLENPERQTMIASFLSHSRAVSSNSSRNFLYPHGLELSAHVERGEMVVMAFYPDHSPLERLNRFEVSRHQQNTLVRTVVQPKTR